MFGLSYISKSILEIKVSTWKVVETLITRKKNQIKRRGSGGPL